MLEDLRSIQLLDWLENDLLLPVETLQLASSDASFRRYFRVVSPDGSFIAMDAPPDREKLEPFIKVAGLLREAGVRAPEIFQQNLSDGFLLLEDFGGQNFLDGLSMDSADTLYQGALDSLFRLQNHRSLLEADLPRYDEALLRRELDIFSTWFIGDYLDSDIPVDIWETLQSLLIESALSQPVTFVHRDYHSRNLMVLPDGVPGVLDFQDAVLGPITYDLASLLRDCYIAWPPVQWEAWLQAYRQRLTQAGLIDCDTVLFKQWFDWMGLQRHLKAIGIFSRLHLRDGKSGYLADIPRTLNYVAEVCAAYSELAEFGQFLLTEVRPRFNREWPA